MAQHNKEENTALAEKVAGFISKNKFILWGILAVLIIITVVLAVVDKRISDRNIMYSDTAIELQSDFQGWFSALEEDKDEAATNSSIKFLKL